MSEGKPFANIMLVASHLTFKGKERWDSQSRTMGPSQRLASSQACMRGEDLAKQPAANSTNGVVGSNGSCRRARCAR